MGRKLFAVEVNRRFRSILHNARVASGKSCAELAEQHGMTEDAFQTLEQKASRVPLCVLYRVMASYGSKTLYEVQFALYELGSHRNQDADGPERDHTP